MAIMGCASCKGDAAKYGHGIVKIRKNIDRIYVQLKKLEDAPNNSTRIDELYGELNLWEDVLHTFESPDYVPHFGWVEQLY